MTWSFTPLFSRHFALFSTERPIHTYKQREQEKIIKLLFDSGGPVLLKLLLMWVCLCMWYAVFWIVKEFVDILATCTSNCGSV